MDNKPTGDDLVVCDLAAGRFSKAMRETVNRAIDKALMNSGQNILINTAMPETAADIIYCLKREMANSGFVTQEMQDGIQLRNGSTIVVESA